MYSSAPLGSIRAPTLASVIARRIEDEVVGQGWPVGQVLGSESELLERFGVSRAVFREAVRVLEHTGAARMRRGPGGGLVVSRPSRSGVVSAMSVWFSYVGVTVEEMSEARLALLEGACRMAAAQSDRAGRCELAAARIQAAVGTDPTSWLLAAIEADIASLANSPALILFVQAVADLGISRLRAGRARLDPPIGIDEIQHILRGYRMVVEDVSAGDGEAAAARIRSIVGSLHTRMVETRPRRDVAIAGSDASGKRAEAVATSLRDYIEQTGWPVGEVIGSEADLIERLGVSRAILREAVRILEHHGAVVTKRGPRGGIIVRAPDGAAIVRSARMILEYEGVTPTSLSESRAVIEVAVARLATVRCTPALAETLNACLAREKRTGDAAVSFGDLHHAIAEGTGNRLLVLFVDVMGELVPGRFKPERRTPSGQAELSGEVHQVHERLVQAIVAGDADRAARRMERHMRASAAVFD